MKHTIIKYMGWSLNNNLIGADRDWRIRERHRAKMHHYLVDAEFDDTYQPRCKKCGWDITYCEPHWETSLMSYGYSTGRWNNRHYHLHCYKKDTTEYSVYPVCRHEDGTDEDSIKTGADPRVLKHSICHITTKDYIWKMKEVIEVGHD